jgi:HTH-type transcriptional regulator/antitoxin HipB
MSVIVDIDPLSAIVDFAKLSAIVDIKERHMHIRTPLELGALLRDLRTKRGLDQGTLARQVGVSRQWIVAIEKGKPGAPIGLVLRTLGALGVSIDIEDILGARAQVKKGSGKKNIDLVDQVLSRLQDKKS